MAECNNDCSMYSHGYLHAESVEPVYVNFRGQGQHGPISHPQRSLLLRSHCGSGGEHNRPQMLCVAVNGTASHSYGVSPAITQCYLPPVTSEHTPLYPGGLS